MWTAALGVSHDGKRGQLYAAGSQPEAGVFRLKHSCCLFSALFITSMSSCWEMWSRPLAHKAACLFKAGLCLN